MDILAHTSSWKTEANIAMTAEAVAKLMRRPPGIGEFSPSIMGWISFRRTGSIPSTRLDRQSDMFAAEPHVHTISRETGSISVGVSGVVCPLWYSQVCSALREAVVDIYQSVDDEGICRAPVLEIKDWGAYGGFRLEVDWKSKIRKACDVTFRALLIMQYANI